MIYIYTEDSSEGLLLMKNAVNLYLRQYNNIKADTINGISKLAEHIRNLNINSDDTVYYIYDNITENIAVQQHLINSLNMIRLSKYKEQIKLVPILCCEYSVLTAEHIELFAKYSQISYIKELKSYKDTGNITINTKKNKIFEQFYAKARKERERTLKSRQVRTGETYTNNDIEEGISIEKLCKKIMIAAFDADLKLIDSVNNTFGKCWNTDCCFKKNRICSMHVNTRKLHGTEKLQFLAEETVYIKIIKLIANDNQLSISTDIGKLNLADITFRKEAQLEISKYESDKIQEIHTIKECAANLDLYMNEFKYSEKKAVAECIRSGYTEKYLNY
jgi:hypothetical protein